MNTTTQEKFAVEGHGRGTLCVRGDDSRSFANKWSRESKFSKAAAWEIAKDMMREGDMYHTVHVKPYAYAPREEAVFTAWRDREKGVWISAKTGEVIKL